MTGVGVEGYMCNRRLGDMGKMFGPQLLLYGSSKLDQYTSVGGKWWQ